MIEELRFVRYPAKELDDFKRFLGGAVGLQSADGSDDIARFRSDERSYSVECDATGATGKPVVGFSVRYQSDLDDITGKLTACGLEPARLSAEVCAGKLYRDAVAFEDFAGNRFEIVVRHENKSQRFFPARDAGIKAISSVDLRSPDPERDMAIWTEVFGARVRDFAGESGQLGFDERHHRIAYYPSQRSGLLSVNFEVGDLNDIMRSKYLLANQQVRILDGPGRDPASGEVFLYFQGPEDLIVSYGTGMKTVEPDWTARQFRNARDSFCMWNSDGLIPERWGADWETQDNRKVGTR